MIDRTNIVFDETGSVPQLENVQKAIEKCVELILYRDPLDPTKKYGLISRQDYSKFELSQRILKYKSRMYITTGLTADASLVLNQIKHWEQDWFISYRQIAPLKYILHELSLLFYKYSRTHNLPLATSVYVVPNNDTFNYKVSFLGGMDSKHIFIESRNHMELYSLLKQMDPSTIDYTSSEQFKKVLTPHTQYSMYYRLNFD